MGVWTSAGLSLAATAIQTSGADVALKFVAISPGCGTLASAITSGVAVTSLALDAALPANLSGGATLTVTDGTNSETVTVTVAGALAGATSIPINSWTPTHSYAAHTTGVCPTPQSSDVALYNETQRLATTAASSGSNPGESLLSGYFDGAQPTSVYLLVGWFAGSNASATLGTGTLMAEDIVYWNHTANADTFMYQGDATI